LRENNTQFFLSLSLSLSTDTTVHGGGWR